MNAFQTRKEAEKATEKAVFAFDVTPMPLTSWPEQTCPWWCGVCGYPAESFPKLREHYNVCRGIIAK